MMDGNELKDLRELIEFLRANEIAEFDLEKDDLKVRLKFATAAAASAPVGMDMLQLARLMASTQALGPQAVAAPAVAMAAPGEGGSALAGSPVNAVVEAVVAKHHVVKSPIVGTFYESPSPGSPAFVKAGDLVEVGQVLCIVEAMKLMNEIESDAAGEIVERIAIGGQPVEYGQALFTIKPR